MISGFFHENVNTILTNLIPANSDRIGNSSRRFFREKYLKYFTQGVAVHYEPQIESKLAGTDLLETIKLMDIERRTN